MVLRLHNTAVGMTVASLICSDVDIMAEWVKVLEQVENSEHASLYCSAAGTLILSFINNITLPTLFTFSLVISVHVMSLQANFSFCSSSSSSLFIILYIFDIIIVVPGSTTRLLLFCGLTVRTGSRSAVRWTRWGSGAAIRWVKGSVKSSLQTLGEHFRWERGESSDVTGRITHMAPRRRKENTLMHLQALDQQSWAAAMFDEYALTQSCLYQDFFRWDWLVSRVLTVHYLSH